MPSGEARSSVTLFLLRLNAAKKPAPVLVEVARGVALARGLHLDDLGAEVGQHQPAGRAHHHVGELDDADALEGKRRLHAFPPAAARRKVFGRPASGTCP